MGGVRSMKLRPGDGVAEMSIMEGEGEGGGYVLAVTKKGYGKRIPITEFRSQGRGGIGVIAIKFKEPVDGDEMDSMSCLTLVKEDDEILVTTKRGVIVRQKCSAI